MMNGKIIGVVAGAGPLAGIDLLSKIADQTVAQRDQDHLTVVSLSEPSSIWDRTAFLLGEVDVNPAGAIANQLLKLAQAGAQVAAIPCNTAHAPAIFDVVQARLAEANCPIHFLHMIEEVARFLQEHYPTVQRVGLLATTGTVQTGVYERVLHPAGYTLLTPPATMQTALIHPAIADPALGIKALGAGASQARENLLAGVREVSGRGAELIILGCTEIPLVLTEPEINGLPLVDPTLILARALIREADPGKLKSMKTKKIGRL